MTLIEIIMTGIALSMDAFATSICKGLYSNKIIIKNSLIIGTYFGGFQALMPLLGYTLGNILKEKLIMYNSYIALILLIIIGISMLKDKDNNEINAKINYKEMLILSITTSIDAFIIGISLSFLEVNIFISIILIGSITFIISSCGYLIGNILGKKLQKYAKIIGGITLIFLGIKIFITNLLK